MSNARVVKKCCMNVIFQAGEKLIQHVELLLVLIVTNNLFDFLGHSKAITFQNR